MGKPAIGVLTIMVARSAAEVLNGHVALALECLDRMYVNAYVPMLQSEWCGSVVRLPGVAWISGAFFGADSADKAVRCGFDRALRSGRET